ncbi:protein phosphatase 2C domain-containing protein [Kitasatospora sp. DSM 101779]|uniref:protein phosphatase 2C domain-containing protein n=1 Tax=Kitasatospora sp. DSM 101779 TaxID=2853165 RepID=UPI0021DB6703|nr:protein phosphatase 2C domain-containing protein [Kitasatospora sp. DSM 101779]MCU7825461.1 protein phosphatase 2C domain-containing protein [Kitasatospora sp. DSM 101779]
MSNQGASPHDRPEDGWWQAVYAGPAGTLPDAPGAAGGEGSVDDWFDSAAGMIGPQRTGTPAGPAPEAAPVPEAGAPTHESAPAGAAPKDAPAPSRPHWAPPVKPAQDPAAEPAPRPVPAPTPSRPHWAPPAAAEREPAVPPAARPEPAAAPPRPSWVPLARTGPDPAAAAEPGVDEPGVDEPSVDDWFDMAAGVIGGPRPAPAVAEEQAPSAPEPVDDAEPEPTLTLGTVRRRVPEPAPAAPGPVDGAEPEPTLTLGTVRRPGPEPDTTVDVRPAGRPAAPVTGPTVILRKLASPDADRPESTTSAPARPAQVEPAPAEAAPAQPAAAQPRPAPRRIPLEPPVPHVGERPPTYSPEPTALPASDPAGLGAIVPDTVLDGAQYGPAILRAASVRGDSARFRGEPRRDALLVTRFGEGEDGLVLAVVASPARSADAATGSAAAAEAARQLAAAIGRSRVELAADLRAGARDRLRYGLQRLTVGAAARLRPAGDPPVEPGDAESGALHCLLVPLDGEAGHRAAFGTGPGGLYLLRSGHWIDAYAARLLHHPDGEPQPAAAAAAPRPFRFRMVPATTGDILLLCTAGLAGPIADEPAVARFLSNHWAHPHPPGSVDFLRQVQVRAKGYADDRTAAALWTE